MKELIQKIVNDKTSRYTLLGALIGGIVGILFGNIAVMICCGTVIGLCIGDDTSK